MEHGRRHIPTNRLKKERQVNKYNQNESSWILEVNQPELSNWESGEIQPNLSHAFDLANLYGTTTEQLFFEEYQASKKRISLRKEALKAQKTAGNLPNDKRLNKKTNRSVSINRK